MWWWWWDMKIFESQNLKWEEFSNFTGIYKREMKIVFEKQKKWTNREMFCLIKWVLLQIQNGLTTEKKIKKFILFQPLLEDFKRESQRTVYYCFVFFFIINRALVFFNNVCQNRSVAGFVFLQDWQFCWNQSLCQKLLGMKCGLPSELLGRIEEGWWWW